MVGSVCQAFLGLALPVLLTVTPAFAKDCASWRGMVESSLREEQRVGRLLREARRTTDTALRCQRMNEYVPVLYELAEGIKDFPEECLIGEPGDELNGAIQQLEKRASEWSQLHNALCN